MNIVLWIGNAPNQRALANKLAEAFNVVGIVTETRKTKRRITIKKIIEVGFERIFLSSINGAWRGMQEFYEKNFPDYPNVSRLDVENINSTNVLEFSYNLKPDLIVVSGTRLIRKKLLSIDVSKGILNLHTGLSPYIKGGPNCTNWCIATNQFHLVGNTVMWIDEGIDSGNIVTSEFTDIDWGNMSLFDIHIRVMEHAHSLYKKAINFILNGGQSNVPQSEIGDGKTFYTKEWSLIYKIKLIRNLKRIRKEYNPNDIAEKRKKIKTIKI